MNYILHQCLSYFIKENNEVGNLMLSYLSFLQNELEDRMLYL